MDDHKRISAVGLLLVGVLFAFGMQLCAPPTKVAHAQASGGVPSVDTWSGHVDLIAPVTSILVTSSTQLIAAVSGQKIDVRAIVIDSDTAGAVQLQDGSGGTTLATFYCAANTNVLIPEAHIGANLRTSKGNGLYAIGPSGAHLIGSIRYQLK